LLDGGIAAIADLTFSGQPHSPQFLDRAQGAPPFSIEALTADEQAVTMRIDTDTDHTTCCVARSRWRAGLAPIQGER
jgi:hypothetical protein